MSNIKIEPDKEILSTRLIQHYRKVSNKVREDGIHFITKNNKPDLVIMPIEQYERMLDIVNGLNDCIDKIEHIECKRDIVESEKTDDGTRYTIDDVFNEIEKENPDARNCK